MDNWLTIIIIVCVVAIIVGNFSTFRRTAHKPMRQQSLNDLKETIPRTNKTAHTMSSQDTKRKPNVRK